MVWEIENQISRIQKIGIEIQAFEVKKKGGTLKTLPKREQLWKNIQIFRSRNIL